MSAAAAREALKYRLRSPGDGIYRVRLTESSGEASAEAFFAGARDEQVVELPPGDYWAMVADVATGAAHGRIPISFADAAEPVSLDIPEDGSNRPASAYGARGAIDHRSSAIDRWDSRQSLAEFQAAEPEPPPRFDIAISEDHAPGSVGGWAAPEELDISIRPRDGLSPLELGVRDRKEGRKSRVRMSIGIEGLPTIRVPLPLYRDGIVVRLRPAPDAQGGADCRVEVAATNPKLQALVTALDDLSASEAISVLNWAAEGPEDSAIAFLAEKVRDLWAATAAAVLLVKLGRIANVAAWLRNLARLAPHIADASIAAAWASIASVEGGDIEAAESQAMDYLARAGRIGAPNYTAANSLNLELLSSLHATALDRKVRDRAAQEYRRATERSRFRLFKSPYMIWEEAGERLQGGRLAGDHYLRVANGRVGAAGFELAGVAKALSLDGQGSDASLSP